MASFEPQNSCLPFASGETLLRRLDPVIDCVAQQMTYRSLQQLQNVAIDECSLARDFQCQLFAKRFPQISNESRETLHAIQKGTHPAINNFLIQPC